MKKCFVFMILLITLSILFAGVEQPLSKTAVLDRGITHQRTDRDVPYYEFTVDPTDLTTTYYDYMNGSYNSLPVRVQPEFSEPQNLPAGGVYIVYHTKETASTNRREFYTYIDPDGNVLISSPISMTDIWEGYGGIDIDPITADPFVAYHINFGSVEADVMGSYDLFHLIGGHGLWREPFPIIDNNSVQTPYEDDSFCWPYVYIGPSPLENEYRRVYVVANNFQSHDSDDLPSENVLIAQADYLTADLDNQSSLEWTYNTIPLLDDWNNGDPWIRPFQACAVSEDGKIAYMGYNSDDEIYVFLNDNYGVGEYTYISEDYQFWIDNPMNESGTEHTFLNDNGNPYNLYFGFINSGHMNVIFNESGTKLLFNGALGLKGEDPDDPEGGVYWPFAIYPKVLEFDIAANEFHFQNLDTAINANAVNPDYVWSEDEIYIPWDTDNDGLVDEFDGDGSVLWFNGWPIYFYDNDTAFHENIFKITKNEEKGWMAAIWQDGLKAKLANDGVEGYEDWAEVPEIAISVSGDNGASWTEPILMNANDTPELADMIPVYVYPGDLIEEIDETHGKLHLFFLDDYSFGSSVQNFGIANGGMLKYAAINIEFPTVSADNEIYHPAANLRCFPNPFKNMTTISFQINGFDPENAELSIYNIKGQKIRSFQNLQIDKFPNQQILWDGKDENNLDVASGIYLYRLKTGKDSVTEKMILMR